MSGPFVPQSSSGWPKSPLKKRIIICCDGTWQASNHGSQNIPSNAAKMSHCLANHFTIENGDVCPQVIYYDAGVGAGMQWVQSKIVGLTGEGLDENVCEAYNFLVANYNSGDEVFFFGFSRGAYTVRAAAGLVCNVGICKPTGMTKFWEVYAMYKAFPHQDLNTTPWAKRLAEGEKATKFTIKVNGEDKEFETESGWSWMNNSRREVDVKVVGVWDTVGSLGIPGIKYIPFWTPDNSAYGFHDTAIHPEIKNAFHALALDEHRKPFSPAMWTLPEGSSTNLIQCWFPGSHINIGGGSEDGLGKRKGDLECMANTTFAWMVDRCQPFLKFDDDPISQIMGDYLEALEAIIARKGIASHYGGWGRSGPLHDSYKGVLGTIWGSEPRKPGEYFDATRTGECIHPVVYHARLKQQYESPSLEGFERFPAKDGIPPHWIKTYERCEPALGGMSYVPGFGTKSAPQKVTVKLPEFVIPKICREPGPNGFGYPIERSLIYGASHRLPIGLSDDEIKKRSRAADNEGALFMEILDKENAALLG